MVMKRNPQTIGQGKSKLTADGRVGLQQRLESLGSKINESKVGKGTGVEAISAVGQE